MTAFSLINKLLGVFLRLFLSARIGSEGMGLYQLIMSVYSMFSTFATAGFTLSVSRLVAEKEMRNSSDAKLLLSNSFIASAVISIIATIALLLSADFFALNTLGDSRCGAPLRILALSMPFMALAACLKGWFLAKQRVIITASASLFEQLVKMAVIALCLNVFLAGSGDIGDLCGGIVVGATVSEICSFCYLWLFKIFSSRDREYTPTETRRDNMKSLLSVTSPIALTVYITSILHTVETLLIPFVFERYSGDRSSALSSFGMIRGMVIPILFFPFAFLGSLVSVFTPEISRLNILPDRKPLNSKISSIMSCVSLASVAVGGLFFFLATEIGEAFYPNENTETAIRILSLVTPFMYVETVSDGILKAIGEQVETLKFSIYNSVLRVVSILTFVAHTGENGYLILLVISNSFTYFLCRYRLYKVTGVGVRVVGDVIPALAFSVIGGFAADYALSFLNINGRIASAAAGTSIYIGVFSMLMLLFAGERIKKLFKRIGND